MNIKSLCLLLLGVMSSSPLLAFVHIHKLKPRLSSSPQEPQVFFYWDGNAPELSGKEEVLGGVFADASDHDLMRALLEQAVDTWSTVDSSYLQLIVEEEPTAREDSEDEIHSIVVNSLDSISVAAAAQPNFRGRGDADSSGFTKVIRDCDIVIGANKVKAKFLLRTLVHELGHCIGLGHPHSSYRSIMSYSPLDDDANLSLDDKAGVSFLYPAEDQSERVRELVACGMTGRSTDSALPFLFLLFPPFWATVRLLQRKYGSAESR